MRINSKEETNMKHYEVPEMEIILLSDVDVITESKPTEMEEQDV